MAAVTALAVVSLGAGFVARSPVLLIGRRIADVPGEIEPRESTE